MEAAVRKRTAEVGMLADCSGKLAAVPVIRADSAAVGTVGTAGSSVDSSVVAAGRGSRQLLAYCRIVDFAQMVKDMAIASIAVAGRTKLQSFEAA